ncbi:hypothetical protein [Kordiimonas laminariae]|uniref:hypothetical protein n=1 Tax=Kordiimonas laminariae TaxID=2917717 RepID=UPI001FF69E79|nr:hypothetical protein [Kordiimonas laminariae]MCK0069630.1 hypothetical protein [Kordiimonas laminariae]
MTEDTQKQHLGAFKTYVAICLSWLVGMVGFCIYHVADYEFDRIGPTFFSTVLDKFTDLFLVTSFIGLLFTPFILGLWLLVREVLNESPITTTIFGGLIGISFGIFFPFGTALPYIITGLICGISYWKVSRYMLKPKQA